MRIIRVSDLTRRSVSAHESQGLAIGGVAGDPHVTVVVLDVGGRIGRHPAVVDQCLVLVSGDAQVNGDDGSWHRLRPGEAAVWAAGEDHETHSRNGLTALVLEGAGLAAELG